ncbi:MAG TPA: lysozyme inhibitor LprI family protein, partial [Candidatus Methylacidiphilales bacterium]|nr:lysozyme inhibitor LprI family protein [Candidatus Methylacidiphilales bacterium]
AAIVSSARAEGDEKHPIDKWYDAQMDKASSTHESRDVIHKALEKWDVELNAAYKELMGQLKPPGKESLKAAQIQWIKFRDSEIEFMKNSIYAMDGTMWLQVGDDRVMRLTRDRALQLRRTLETLSNGG